MFLAKKRCKKSNMALKTQCTGKFKKQVALQYADNEVTTRVSILNYLQTILQGFPTN
jgi:hypothetical protein